jgi:vacuolar protein sorting-associated protein VTA1
MPHANLRRQTADTFQAAATFLELGNIWGPPDAETQSKIKYAKFHAVRIARAIKEGKDPNESNPQPASEPEEELPPLDPNDPEVQILEGAPLRQPTVEEVPDDQDHIDHRMARQSSIDQSLHPSAQVSARGSPAPFDPYPRNGFPYTAAQDDNVSPLEPSPPNDRNGSVGGGYFPEVPTFTSESLPSGHPTAPPEDILDLDLPQQPSFAPGSKSPNQVSSPTPPPQNYYQQAPPPQAPLQQPYFTTSQQLTPDNFVSPQLSTPQNHPPPQQPIPQHFVPSPQPPTTQQQYQQPYQPSPQQYASPSAPPAAPQPPYKKGPLNTDDASIAKAQKHARYALIFT